MDSIEQTVVQFVLREAATHGLRHLAWLGIIGILTVFLGRRWRQMRRDIECLKKRVEENSRQVAMPAISHTINFNATAPDRSQELQNAIEAKTAQNLRETVRSLTQYPLQGGHTYAQLPEGTNIVSMADGSYRLALPISLSVEFGGFGSGEMKVILKKEKRDA